MISSTAIVHPNVVLGRNCHIEDFCIIGAPPRGRQSGEVQTIIGDNAVIRSHTVIYAGNRIGNNFQTGNKVNIREENEIGDDVSVGTLSVIEHHVIIRRGVRIHTQAFIPEFTTLEEGCWIGPNVVFTNAKYPSSPNAKHELKGATVCAGAIICANSTILPGIRIGARSLVGAGSVATRSIADGIVVVGVPATFLKDRQELPYPPSPCAAIG